MLVNLDLIILYRNLYKINNLDTQSLVIILKNSFLRIN